MSEQKRPYIEIEHFSFYYPERTEKVLDDLTLTVEQGEFLVLCGPSGCGKSTLLRQLKTVLAPHGRRLGSIRFEGRPLEELDQREQSAGIGFVQQDPENQIVTDKVWHELAFGLESLGYDTPTIRRRVAEMASFFGIQTWFYKNVTELSGGQKQLLNLASIMAMQPSVLILDEPTSQLDPIAAADFLATLGENQPGAGDDGRVDGAPAGGRLPVGQPCGGHGPRAAALHRESRGGGGDPARGGTLNVPGHADPDADLGIRAGCGRTLPGHGAGGPGLADRVC